MATATVAAPVQQAQPAPDLTGTACPIDFGRYPIDDLDSPAGRRLIAQARTTLADSGCLVLRDFVTTEGLAGLRAQGRALSHTAHVDKRYTNPYSSDDDPSLPEDDPRRRFMERTNGFVGGDLIEPGSAARALYHHKGFQRFVAAAVGKPALYEYADPLADLVFNVLRPGCTHPWHFDNNDFIVSMLTQAPEGGGAFEYCPGLRAAADENYDGVRGVLDGDRGPVRTLNLRPGDLQIFFGRNALHRVTQVEGERERHTLIFAYTEQPGVIAGKARTKLLFGRTHPAHDAAEAAGRTTPASGRAN
jgi:hypothetical protein